MMNTAGDHVTTTSRCCHLQHVVRRRLPTSDAARIAAVQPSPHRAASRPTAATDHPPRGRQDDGCDDDRRQGRRRRSFDTGHSSSSTHTPRLYDHQVQPTHQSGVGEAPNTFLPLRWYVLRSFTRKIVFSIDSTLHCCISVKHTVANCSTF